MTVTSNHCLICEKPCRIKVCSEKNCKMEYSRQQNRRRYKNRQMAKLLATKKEPDNAEINSREQQI